MNIPNHLLRYPTNNARVALARKLSISFDGSSQDWEWEVADSARIDDFLNVYKSGELTEDEMFSLMEIILQSFEDFNDDSLQSAAWTECISLIRNNIYTHIYSVYYWSMIGEDKPENCFRITAYMRSVLIENKFLLENV
jgi:hypothetical protein